MSTRRLQARQDRRAPTAAPAAGRALPGAVRARMEAAFGADFSDVRVHEDDRAAALGAAAYTRGSEISFQPGLWDSASREGLEALGHELAHVLQQRAGRVPGTGVTEVPALEAEAHEAGERVARGEPVGQVGDRAGGSPPAGPGPAQPGRFGDLFRSVFRRGREEPEEESPYQPIPPDVQARETPYQPIPQLRTRQGVPWSQMDSPYASLPAFGGDLEANTPPRLARYPQQPPPRPPVPLRVRFGQQLEQGPTGTGVPRVVAPAPARGILRRRRG